ncbi:hypothetical protein V1507DRAFT_296862 [Lipomyces tetrasporus]
MVLASFVCVCYDLSASIGVNVTCITCVRIQFNVYSLKVITQAGRTVDVFDMVHRDFGIEMYFMTSNVKYGIRVLLIAGYLRLYFLLFFVRFRVHTYLLLSM